MAIGGFAPLPLRLGGTGVDGWTAAQHARCCADLVAIKRTAPLYWVRFVTAAPGAPTVTSYWGRNGAGLLYPPDSITSPGAGVSVFTWTARGLADSYGVIESTPIRHAQATYEAAVSGYCTVEITDATTITVRLSDNAGVGLDGPVSLVVW